MKDSKIEDTRTESGQRFMDGLLREKFSNSHEKDKARIDGIINKIHSLERQTAPMKQVPMSSSYLFKGLATAASLVLVSLVVLYVFKGSLVGKKGDTDSFKPFLLVSDKCEVYENGDRKNAIATAKTFTGNETLNVSGGGSAFIIFPDLVKLEIAADSSLKLNPPEEGHTDKRFSAAPTKKIDIHYGVFRLDTSSSNVNVTTEQGTILASDAKVVIIAKGDYCYGEVVKGTVAVSRHGSGDQPLKVPMGSSFILKADSCASHALHTKDASFESIQPQIDVCKKTLIDNRKYDNLLRDLLNRSAADVCLNKGNLRKIIKNI